MGKLLIKLFISFWVFQITFLEDIIGNKYFMFNTSK